MNGIGTRQRHHHPVGRPADSLPVRTAASAASGKPDSSCSRRLTQLTSRPHRRAQLLLGQALALHQLAQQQGLLDDGERAILRARQHPQHRLGQPAGPLLDAGRVAAQPAQRGNPPIPVDQHPWV